MKRLIYILTIAILSITACKKEMPEPDSLGLGIPSTYTNKYILTGIQGGVYINDTVWYDAHYYRITPVKVKDTVKYSDCYIKLDFKGNLVGENTFFSGTNAIERKYFINRISFFYICSDSGNFFMNCYRYDRKGKIIEGMPVKGQLLGYAPIKFTIVSPPNTDKWVSFDIIIGDDQGNVFKATTQEVFLTR